MTVRKLWRCLRVRLESHAARSSAGMFRAEPLEARRLLAATPFIQSGSGTFEGGTLSLTVGVRVGYGDQINAERQYSVGLSTDGTATAGLDFIAPAPVTVVLPANAMSATATVLITTLRDNWVEGGETVIATASSISGSGSTAVTSPPSSLTLSIGDDPPRVSIHGGMQAVEGGAPVALTASRTGGKLDEELQVTLVYSGTASAGRTTPHRAA